MKKSFLITTSFFLFAILLVLGFNRAQQKPIWNDETYTQTGTIEQFSIWHIITEGPATAESNTSPLFYVFQKGICQILSYHVPADWTPGAWLYWDNQAQIILRIQPVVFMALAMILLFYYFGKNYSFWMGSFALILSLSSYMMWIYWAEGRPYALWVFLTVWQTLLFLEINRKRSFTPKLWRQLGLVHMLMILTVIFSIVQIAAASLIVWFFYQRDLKKYLFIAYIPLALTPYYYLKMPAAKVNVTESFMHSFRALIVPCVPIEQMLLVVLLILGLGIYWVNAKTKKIPLPRIADDQILQKFSLFFVLLFLAGLSFIVTFYLRAEPGGNPISTRYFIFLTPVGIIATTLIAQLMLQLTQPYKWLRFNLVLGFIGFLIIGFLRNAYWVVRFL